MVCTSTKKTCDSLAILPFGYLYPLTDENQTRAKVNVFLCSYLYNNQDIRKVCIPNISIVKRHMVIYVSLRLHVQNRRKKWNFPLNFRTMRKLSDLYSRIFQTQSSGCASGVDLFRNFTKLKILNIWIVKYLLNCKRYLSYNFWIFQKISECWVLKNLDVHLKWTTSELEFWNFQHAFYSFQNILKFQHAFYSFQNMLKISTCFFIDKMIKNK